MASRLAQVVAKELLPLAIKGWKRGGGEKKEKILEACNDL